MVILLEFRKLCYRVVIGLKLWYGRCL